ncbi:hypothetical protein D5125_14400 [Magnetovirga frankeli]|uniref:multiheme c-type cytochrome n=1 Tax=Magnetovirga frankeli TaxID=947516 RepID=UPI001293CB3F|nr:hypothetical protein D5125_14400 [gamma proteobacterium SS-5]
MSAPLRACLALLFLSLLAPPLLAAKVKLDPSHWGLEGGEECVKCHSKTSAGIVLQWRDSAHGKENVNCLDCHQADAAEVDAIEHEGFTIATIVSPKDCGRCHEQEEKQNSSSVHVNAIDLLGRAHPFLAQDLGGQAAADASCAQCHGAKVEVRGDGSLDPATWPNSGIGRINPDGSKGSCSACHGRHSFSKAQARQPEACTVCHQGLDSPDKEVFEASPHGRAYASQKDKMNLDSDSWVAGKDYAASATCVTCHMGAAGKLPSGHDVGLRSAWKLNRPVSEQQHLVLFEDGDKRTLLASEPKPARGAMMPKYDGTEAKVKLLVPADRRRKAMTQVCLECHAKNTIEGFMQQFDSVIELYNAKFGRPAQAIMADLYEQGLLSPAPFDEPLELTYWRLWHDEGVRARHGAAMMSPEHTGWQGMHQLGQNFYGQFLPQVRALGKAAEALIQQHLQDRPEHAWLTQGADTQTPAPEVLGVGNRDAEP